jgi:hypothetical protein
MTVHFLMRLAMPPSVSLSRTRPLPLISASFAAQSGTETHGLSISRFLEAHAWATKQPTKLSAGK